MEKCLKLTKMKKQAKSYNLWFTFLFEYLFTLDISQNKLKIEQLC